MRLAIVGSTMLAGHPTAALLIEAVLDLLKPEVVISGGAAGIDTMAEEAAKRRGIPVVVYRPAVSQWAGPGGFAERNLKVANDCDRLVRIVAVQSTTYGSGWTRDRAKEMGKPTYEYRIDHLG